MLKKLVKSKCDILRFYGTIIKGLAIFAINVCRSVLSCVEHFVFTLHSFGHLAVTMKLTVVGYVHSDTQKTGTFEKPNKN